MEPVGGIYAAAEDTHAGHGPHGPSSLDLNLAAELGLLASLEGIARAVGHDAPPPAVARLTLTTTNANGEQRRGNPVDWQGYRALTVAIYNANPFPVYVGQGAGSGTAGGANVVVPALALAVLPMEDNVYSFGAAASSLGSTDWPLYVIRYATALPPALFELAPTGDVADGALDSGAPTVKVGGIYQPLGSPPNYTVAGARVPFLFANRGEMVTTVGQGTARAGVGTPADGDAQTTALLTGARQQFWNGGSWQLGRTPATWKVVVGVTITTETTVWTPAAGKKFRVMAIYFTSSSAVRVTFRDGTAGTQFCVTAPNAGLPNAVVFPGNGYLSSTINNVLTAQSSAVANLDATIVGMEE